MAQNLTISSFSGYLSSDYNIIYNTNNFLKEYFVWHGNQSHFFISSTVFINSSKQYNVFVSELPIRFSSIKYITSKTYTYINNANSSNIWYYCITWWRNKINIKYLNVTLISWHFVSMIRNRPIIFSICF